MNSSQTKRIAGKMKMLAGSLRIAADVIESLSRSVREVADLLDEDPEEVVEDFGGTDPLA